MYEALYSISQIYNQFMHFAKSSAALLMQRSEGVVKRAFFFYRSSDFKGLSGFLQSNTTKKELSMLCPRYIIDQRSVSNRMSGKCNTCLSHLGEQSYLLLDVQTQISTGPIQLQPSYFTARQKGFIIQTCPYSHVKVHLDRFQRLANSDDAAKRLASLTTSRPIAPLLNWSHLSKNPCPSYNEIAMRTTSNTDSLSGSSFNGNSRNADQLTPRHLYGMLTLLLDGQRFKFDIFQLLYVFLLNVFLSVFQSSSFSSGET